MVKAMVRCGTTSTSLGTGTTKTLLGAASVILPGDARTLKSFYPQAADITSTTVQTITTKFELESSDVRNLTPFEVLAAPIGAVLGATANTLTGMEKWDVEAICKGSDQVNVYGTALVANAVAPEGLAWMMIDTEGARMQQRHAKMGTITAIGTTEDTDVAGTKYTFSGGSKIIELFGSAHYKTIAAGDALIGGIKYTSSEFVTSLPQELPLYPFSFGLGSTGSALIPGVSRLPNVDIPLKPGQVAIQDYANCGILPAASDSMFIDGVVYV